MRYIERIDMLINEELVHSVEKVQRKSGETTTYSIAINIDREIKTIKCGSLEERNSVFEDIKRELCRK